MTTMQVQAVSGKAFQFTGNLPMKKGVGGGGGRPSVFLDQIRAALSDKSQGGFVIDVPVPAGEKFSDAVKRYTGRLYRKGAIHDADGASIPFVLRSDPDAKTLTIVREDLIADNSASNGTVAAAAGAAPAQVNVQLPTPAPGDTLEVKIAGQDPITVSHKGKPAATVTAPPAKAGKAGKRR